MAATSDTVGNITASMTADNAIIFTGATNNTSFTLGVVSAFSDGTATGGSLSRGIVAGVMYADISCERRNSALATVDHAIEKINSARSTLDQLSIVLNMPLII